MGERSPTSTIETLVVPPPPPSYTPQTSSIPPTSVPSISPTFQGFMNEKITMMFSSQSIERYMQIHEEEGEDEMVGFFELDLNHKEIF